MYISDLPSTKNLPSAVIQELRNHGVKYRVKKSHSKNQRCDGGAIFGAPLQTVPRQTVTCCGTTLQVPSLVHEACCFLRTSVHFEGLFRKAGSQARQKDIKRLLETGCKIDKSYHAVDIAGILKLYLRSLPEPLLDWDMQEVLLRCLLIPSDNFKMTAIQNALLLLPSSRLDILHYIMEFFRYVSSKSEANKMDSGNLAIVLAPSIMPLPSSCPPQRMDQHVRLIKILIENASKIGLVSSNVLKHLEEDMDKENEEKIKKKRRSGSLTRMLNGLRKIVSGSSGQHKATTPDFLATPVLDKCRAKRKQDEHLGLSAKKRKEILNTLPQQPLCTPVRSLGEKEYKKLRLSIGRKPKDKANDFKIASRGNPNEIISKPTFPIELNNDLNQKSKESDFVTISKMEYEAIKQRVSAIENRLSQEFNVITAVDNNHVTEPVKQVQSAYEKTCEEAASLASPTTEHLAKRLSRELKIRRSDEHKIIRSPSARKIGTLRRRSRDNVTKLSRTNTWNASSQTSAMNSANEYLSQANLRRGRPNTIKSGLIQPSLFLNLHPVPQNNTMIKRRISVTGATLYDTSQVNSVHPYPTRNLAKRNSCHGEKEKQTATNNKSNSVSDFEWKTTKSFLSNVESIENHLTGRASVAKLRSQNAGMVLAKAKLFDGMTDSDTSLEKKVSTKSVRHTGFARKPRKNVNDLQNKQGSNSKDENDASSCLTSDKSDENISKTSVGMANHLQSQQIKLPTEPLVKPNFNLSAQLKDVIYDICTPMSEKVDAKNGDKLDTPVIRLNIKVNGVSRSSRNSTPIKKSQVVKNNNKNTTHVKHLKPLQNTAGDARKQSTPVRLNHSTPRRQSPRLTSIKTRCN